MMLFFFGRHRVPHFVFFFLVRIAFPIGLTDTDPSPSFVRDFGPLPPFLKTPAPHPLPSPSNRKAVFFR